MLSTQYKRIACLPSELRYFLSDYEVPSNSFVKINGEVLQVSRSELFKLVYYPTTGIIKCSTDSIILISHSAIADFSRQIGCPSYDAFLFWFGSKRIISEGKYISEYYLNFIKR